jgi:hypothetical protein
MTDPRQELQRVLSGEIETANILHLSKKSGYHLFRVKEIAEEMGLSFAGVPGTQDSYRAILPPPCIYASDCERDNCAVGPNMSCSDYRRVDA